MFTEQLCLLKSGCESPFEGECFKRGRLLQSKFKIRANYPPSDYETVEIEISAVNRRVKWTGNL